MVCREKVKDVARELTGMTKEKLREGYDRIPPAEYGFPKSDEDFEYTWEWFRNVSTLFQKASEAGRYILFTADQ